MDKEQASAMLRRLFINETNSLIALNKEPQMISVAVKLPSGAIETITNYHDVMGKIDYYRDNYNHYFGLRTRPDVQIVGYMIV